MTNPTAAGDAGEACEDMHPFQGPTGFMSELLCDLPKGHDGQHRHEESGASWD